MKKFHITGMSCASCSARVEKAVDSVTGVKEVNVSLLTNSMTVEGNFRDEDIISAVKNAGYGASLKGENKDEKENLLLRFLSSIVFLLLLMYISMGHVMWGWELPRGLENPVFLGIIEFILTAIIMTINRKFFVNGFKGIIKKAPNMDTLVSLGSGAAFIYSLFVLFMIIKASNDGDLNSAKHLLHDLYFESAAMILALITLGKFLEAKAKGKTTNAIKRLIDLTPKVATVIKDGKEIQVDAALLKVGDIFSVKPGEMIPADGIITEGESSLDEASLTGESNPVDKKAGDRVLASSINQWGYILCRAEKVGEETALGQVIRLVEDATLTKAPIARVADKVSGIFVPVVTGISLVTFLIWIMLTGEVGYALARAISVLVISCPCALGLATPVAIMVGSGVGAKGGILFKTAFSLEESGRCNIVALDKTGTITEGEMSVTDISGEDELLSLAYSLEKKSEHPLSKAICKFAEKKNTPLLPVSDFSSVAGSGLMGEIEGKIIKGGKRGFINIPHEALNVAEALENQGKTVVFFERNGEYLGLIAVSDKIKKDSKEAISVLKKMGIRVVMLTGDNERTAAFISKEAGISEVYSNLLPKDKEEKIKALKNEGKVLMVGDGINDAVALTRANIGVAIGNGTDIAIDSADIVLMKNSLKDVYRLINLSSATLKNIHENLFWAFFYNTLGIPIAAGVFVPLGITLNPMIGAFAMSLSSLFVVFNALRLNFADTEKPKKIKKSKKKEEKTVEITIKIEGMMCVHCSGRVKKALEELPEVAEALVSHEDGTAALKLSKDIDVKILQKIIEDAGYKVID